MANKLELAIGIGQDTEMMSLLPEEADRPATHDPFQRLQREDIVLIASYLHDWHDIMAFFLSSRSMYRAFQSLNFPVALRIGDETVWPHFTQVNRVLMASYVMNRPLKLLHDKDYLKNYLDQKRAEYEWLQRRVNGSEKLLMLALLSPFLGAAVEPFIRMHFLLVENKSLEGLSYFGLAFSLILVGLLIAMYLSPKLNRQCQSKKIQRIAHIDWDLRANPNISSHFKNFGIFKLNQAMKENNKAVVLELLSQELDELEPII